MSRARGRGFEYTHTQRDGTLIQDLTDWSGETAGIDELQHEWRVAAGSPQITASLTVFDDELTLGPHVVAHLAEEWAETAQPGSLEQIGFVSPGIEREAIPELGIAQEFRCFHSLDTAISWAAGDSSI